MSIKQEPQDIEILQSVGEPLHNTILKDSWHSMMCNPKD